MGKKWDMASGASEEESPDEAEEEDVVLSPEDIHANEAFHLAWLKEVFRILKPGGVAKVFAATRTMHRLAAAMQRVGFEELGLTAWAYGSGFPKSLNIQKNLEKMVGVEGSEVTTETSTQYAGYGTALKPAFEPFIVGRKPA